MPEDTARPLSIAVKRGEGIRETLEMALDAHATYDAMIIVGVQHHPSGKATQRFDIICSHLSYLERLGLLFEAITQIQGDSTVD